MLEKNKKRFSAFAGKRYGSHCEPCPYCGRAICFIDECISATCPGCHRYIRVENGHLVG